MLEQHQISEPHWMRTLIEDVLMPAVQPNGFIGPLGYRWWEPDSPYNGFGGWQIAVFPTPNEIRGSHAMDGSLCINGFRLDITKLLGSMTSIKHLSWNAPTTGTGDLDGMELSIQGLFAGKPVWLRIFHMPPHDEPPVYYINPTTGEIIPKE